MPTLILKEDGKTLKGAFKKIFEKFNYILRGKVFIKPNFSGRSPLIPGENTDPKFLKQLIEFIIKNGADEIVVGHGALLGTPDRKFPLEKIIKDGNFSFLNKMEKVKILDLDKEEREVVKLKNFSFSTPKIIKKVDNYINLAKLKTHMETTVTLSLKNQMGLASMADRMNMHRVDLEESIAYLGKLIKPTISIIDAIVAMEGNGPHHGKGRKLNLILASDDMVELDSTACFLIGVDFNVVSHISIAKELGVGKYPEENYLSSIKDYRILDFKLAQKIERFGKSIFVWPTTACSACITVLNEVGKTIKRHPFKNLKLLKKAFWNNKKINIVIGRAENLKLSKNEIIITIGLCAKDFSKKHGLKNLDRCPPSSKEVIEYINNILKSSY